MKRQPILFTLGTFAVSVGMGGTANARDDISLSFELAPTREEIEVAIAPDSAEATPIPVVPLASSPDAPLPVPSGAESPPFAGDSTLPSGRWGGGEALAISTGQSAYALLPPPPPLPAITPIPIPDPITEAAQAATQQLSEIAQQHSVELAFDAFKVNKSENEIASTPSAPETSPSEELKAISAEEILNILFRGGAESLVAKAVGSAEGTRTPQGHKTPAYFGHVDPGNGVWNLGTFSYQHGAVSPEEADARQLKRLEQQAQLIKEKAQQKHLELTTEELLNAIDLANQAPLAALDRGGYLDWLAEARQLQMSGTEAIVHARTKAFLDPDTQRWNAPGLGNNIHSISHDQARRMKAISRALEASPMRGEIRIDLLADQPIATSEVPPPPTEDCPNNILFNLDISGKQECPNQPAIASPSRPHEVASEPSSAATAPIMPTQAPDSTSQPAFENPPSGNSEKPSEEANYAVIHDIPTAFPVNFGTVSAPIATAGEEVSIANSTNDVSDSAAEIQAEELQEIAIDRDASETETNAEQALTSVSNTVSSLPLPPDPAVEAINGTAAPPLSETEPAPIPDSGTIAAEVVNPVKSPSLWDALPQSKILLPEHLQKTLTEVLK
jgi:hypothetical protein